jgi:hypothetical protein
MVSMMGVDISARGLYIIFFIIDETPTAVYVVFVFAE